MTDFFSTFFANFHIALVFKVVVLVILFLYIVYSFFLLTQVRALSQLVYIYAQQASRILLFASVVYFFLTLSLFLTALVIL